MATNRSHIPRDIAANVAMLVRRRCCLCWHLDDKKDARKGQIAHLNRKRDDHRLSNLVWLCLDHHDDYDGRTSQSKNYMELEVRRYRNLLIKEFGKAPPDPADDLPSQEMPAAAVDAETKPRSRLNRPWRFPLYQVADQPELFAFTARNSDGVCQIERVHLPDGRILIVCVEIAGNPGTSITNAAEDIADQVCARFGIPPGRLVWLEHYADAEPREWRLVTFSHDDDQGFTDPEWIKMTPKRWRELRVSPRKPWPHDGYRLSSRLTKHFPWPPADGSPLYKIRSEN